MLLPATALRLVLSTSPNRATSKRIARAILENKLAACVNILPGLESHYWWKGKLEKSREDLLLFKATRQTLKKLHALVRKLHPYDTPEFVVLRVDSADGRYLDWWIKSAR